ncbi:MAG: hypothetical protein H0U08_00890 [Actinobacteria bacterium]|nr:hypothetical protein [Actinomycetota bacterium]
MSGAALPSGVGSTSARWLSSQHFLTERLVEWNEFSSADATRLAGYEVVGADRVVGALNRMRNQLAVDPRERATRELIEAEHRRSVERLRPVLDELASAEREADAQVYELYALPAHMRALVETEYET